MNYNIYYIDLEYKWKPHYWRYDRVSPFQEAF